MTNRANKNKTDRNRQYQPPRFHISTNFFRCLFDFLLRVCCPKTFRNPSQGGPKDHESFGRRHDLCHAQAGLFVYLQTRAVLSDVRGLEVAHATKAAANEGNDRRVGGGDGI